ncbi:beta strand repeat-containing protein [Leptothrix sp. BB-4]
MTTNAVQIKDASELLKKLSIQNIRDIRALDVDMLLVMANGDRVILSGGAVAALTQPELLLQFSDGRLTLGQLFGKIDEISLSPEANLTVSSDGITRYNRNNAIVKRPMADAEDEVPARSDPVDKAGPVDQREPGKGPVQDVPKGASAVPGQLDGQSSAQKQVGDTEVNVSSRKTDNWSVAWPTLAAVLGALLVATHKRGSHDSALTAEPMTATVASVSGKAALGTLSDAEVMVYNDQGQLLNKGGKAVALGEGGSYRVEFDTKFAGYKGLVTVVVHDNGAGTNYTDEATGQAMDMGGDLRAIGEVGGGAHVMHVTALTELAVRKAGVAPGGTARDLIADAVGQSAAPDGKAAALVAIQKANNAIAALFSIPDLLTTSPVTINDGEATNAAFTALSRREQGYGLALALVSALQATGTDKATHDETLDLLAATLNYSEQPGQEARLIWRTVGNAAVDANTVQDRLFEAAATVPLPGADAGLTLVSYIQDNQIALTRPDVTARGEKAGVTLDIDELRDGALVVSGSAGTVATLQLTLNGSTVTVAEARLDSTGQARLRITDDALAVLGSAVSSVSGGVVTTTDSAGNSRQAQVFSGLDSRDAIAVDTVRPSTAVTGVALEPGRDSFFARRDDASPLGAEQAYGSADDGVTNLVAQDVRISLNHRLEVNERIEFSTDAGKTWSRPAGLEEVLADGTGSTWIARGVRLVEGANTLRSRVAIVRNDARYADGTDVVIDLADRSQVSINGQQLVIQPARPLARLAHYVLTLPAGAVTDLSGNPFEGLTGSSDATGYDFTTTASNLTLADVAGSDNTVNLAERGGPIVIDLQVNDAGSRTLFDASRYTARLDGTDVALVGASYDAATGRYTARIAGSAFPAGESRPDPVLKITATPNDGSAAASVQRAIHVDTVVSAPDGLRVTAGDPNGDGLVISSGFTLGGNAEKGATVTVLNGSTTVGSVTASTLDGSWSLQVPARLLVRGLMNGAGEASSANGSYQLLTSAEVATTLIGLPAFSDAYAPSGASVLDASRPVYRLGDDSGAWYVWAREGSGYHLTRGDGSTAEWYWEASATPGVFASQPEQVPAGAWMRSNSGAAQVMADAMSGGRAGTTVAQPGAVLVNLDGHGSASHAYTAVQTDLAGNVSAASVVLDVRVDTTAPPAPIGMTLQPVGGNVVADTLNGTNTALELSAFIAAGQATGGKADFYIGSTLLGTDSDIAAGDTAVRYTTSDGTPTPAELQAAITAGGVVSVKLFDAAGNSALSAGGNAMLQRDVIAPAAPTALTLTPSGGTVVANTLNMTSTALALSATIKAGEATGGKAEFYVGATRIGSDTAIAAGDTTVTYTTSDGTPTPAELQAAIGNGGMVSVRLFDAAGNVTSSSIANPTLMRDLVAPTLLSFSATSPDGTYARDAAIVLTATSAEALQPGAQVSVTLDTGATVVLSRDASVATLLRGTYTVAAGQDSADLTVRSYVPGGAGGVQRPRDIAGNTMTGTALPTGTANLGGARAIVVDTHLPTLTLDSRPLAYTENAPATAVDASLTVTDTGGRLTAAAVSISAGYVAGQDRLDFIADFATMGPITGASWNAGSGTLTFTSTGAFTPAQLQAAAAAVQYLNLSDAPSTAARTITFSATNAAGGTETASRSLVVTAVNDLPTGSLVIGGGASPGETLTADTRGLSDPDGNPAAYTYRWKSNGVDILGATGASYLVTSDQVDRILTVQASGTDAGGTVETVTSGGVRVASALLSLDLDAALAGTQFSQPLRQLAPATLAAGAAVLSNVAAPAASTLTGLQLKLSGAGLDARYDKLVLDGDVSLATTFAPVTGKTVGGVTGLSYGYDASTRTLTIGKAGLGAAQVKAIVEAIRLKDSWATPQEGERVFEFRLLNGANIGPASTAVLSFDTQAPQLDLDAGMAGTQLASTRIVSGAAVAGASGVAFVDAAKLATVVAGDVRSIGWTLSGSGMDTARDTLWLDAPVGLAASLATVDRRTVAGVGGLSYGYDAATRTLTIGKTDGSALTAANVQALVGAVGLRNATGVASGNRVATVTLTDLAGNAGSVSATLVVDATAPATLSAAAQAGTRQMSWRMLGNLGDLWGTGDPHQLMPGESGNPALPAAYAGNATGFLAAIRGVSADVAGVATGVASLPGGALSGTAVDLRVQDGAAVKSAGLGLVATSASVLSIQGLENDGAGGANPNVLAPDVDLYQLQADPAAHAATLQLKGTRGSPDPSAHTLANLRIVYAQELADEDTTPTIDVTYDAGKAAIGDVISLFEGSTLLGSRTLVAADLGSGDRTLALDVRTALGTGTHDIVARYRDTAGTKVDAAGVRVAIQSASAAPVFGQVQVNAWAQQLSVVTEGVPVALNGSTTAYASVTDTRTSTGVSGGIQHGLKFSGTLDQAALVTVSIGGRLLAFGDTTTDAGGTVRYALTIPGSSVAPGFHDDVTITASSRATGATRTLSHQTLGWFWAGQAMGDVSGGAGNDVIPLGQTAAATVRTGDGQDTVLVGAYGMASGLSASVADFTPGTDLVAIQGQAVNPASLSSFVVGATSTGSGRDTTLVLDLDGAGVGATTYALTLSNVPAGPAVGHLLFGLPVLTGVACSATRAGNPLSGAARLMAGDLVAVTASYSEPVTGTLASLPTLTIGAETGLALTPVITTGATRSWTYTIASASPADNGAISVAASLVAGLQDASGQVVTDVSVRTGNLVADTTAATVSSVSLQSATGKQNNLLNPDDTVVVQVDFSEPVVVTGVPKLALDIGSLAGAAGGTSVLADYLGGSGSSSLRFRYTVTAGLNDADGIAIPVSGTPATALDLNGGAIRDLAGNAAVLEFAAVADNPAFRVDTAVPAIVAEGAILTTFNSVGVPKTGALTVGDRLRITFTTSEAVTVTGTPTLSIKIGNGARTATYLSGSGSRSLVYQYAIAAGDTAPSGAIYFVAIQGTGLTDSAGNPFDTTYTGNLGVAVPVSVDTTGVPATTVSGLRLSADTAPAGSVAGSPMLTDFVTSVASQTLLGSLSKGLAAGEVVQVSLNNGTTWQTVSAPPTVGGTTFSQAGVTLAASGTFQARVANAAGTKASATLAQPYLLDTTLQANAFSLGTNVVSQPVLSGTAEPNGLITVELDTDGSPASYEASWATSTDALGYWSVNTAAATPVSGSFGGLSIGTTTTARVTATDRAGNSSQVMSTAPVAASTYSISNANVIEGNTGSRTLAYLVTRAGDLSVPGSVGWSVDTALSSVRNTGVANGDFAAGSLFGWTAAPSGGTAPTWGAGAAQFGNATATQGGTLSQVLNTVSGQTYTVSWDQGSAAAVNVAVNNTAATNVVSAAAGARSFTFTASAATTTLTFKDATTAIGTSVSLDNIKVPGTLGASSDYTGATAGTLDFAAGETTRFITFGVNGDYYKEVNDKLQINLGAPVGGVLADGVGTGVIQEVDATRMQAIYSLVDVNPNLVTAAVRVRRSLDNTEQDIGFDAYGRLDTAALSAFVGTGTNAHGYVSKWYDQSGNGRDMGQTLASSQGVLVYNGAIVTRSDGSYGISFNSGLNGGTLVAAAPGGLPTTSGMDDSMLLTNGLAGTGWTDAVISVKVQSNWAGTGSGTLFQLGAGDRDRLSSHFGEWQGGVYVFVFDEGNYVAGTGDGRLMGGVVSQGVANDIVYEVHRNAGSAGTPSLNHIDAAQSIFMDGVRVASDATTVPFSTSATWELARQGVGSGGYYQSVTYSEFSVFLGDTSTSPGSYASPTVTTLRGSSGNDVLTWSGESVLKGLDAGYGYDVLFLQGGTALDATSLTSGVRNVEQVWAVNGAANTVTFDDAALAIDNSTLLVVMDAGDKVVFNGVNLPHDTTDTQTVFLGTTGNDVLKATGLNDHLIGRGGVDTFQWLVNQSGRDRIDAFDIANGNRLDVAALLRGYVAGAVLSNWIEVGDDGVDTTLRIDLDGSGAGSVSQTIVLTGVTTAYTSAQQWADAGLLKVL